MFPKNQETTFDTVFAFNPLNGRMLVNLGIQMLNLEMIMIKKKKYVASTNSIPQAHLYSEV